MLKTGQNKEIGQNYLVAVLKYFILVFSVS